MAKVTLHPTIRRFQGKLGNMVFRLTPSGTISAGKLPDMSRVKWSKAQKAHRQRFREAILYARKAMADPRVRADYEKAGKKAGRQPFRVAVSDFFAGKNLLKTQSPRGQSKGSTYRLPHK